MEIDIEEEIRKRQNEMRQVLARTDPKRIKAAISAYKRDLPRLLRTDKERQVVAYDGKHRVEIAPTLDELMQKLKRRGIRNGNDLFIKHVLPLDDEPEPSVDR